MELHIAFQQAMDNVDIKPSVLADAAGRSRSSISRIRSGSNSPSIRDFGELLGIAEQLKPGFVEEFACQLLGASGFFVKDELSPEQQSRLLILVAKSLPNTQKTQPRSQNTVQEKDLLNVA